MQPERRFLFRLALRLGYANPDRLLEEVPWRIWNEWLEFHELEPFDPAKDEYMLAQIAMLIANAWLKPKDQKQWTVKDFMPSYTEKAESESDRAERLLGFAKDVTLLMGGEFIDGRGH